MPTAQPIMWTPTAPENSLCYQFLQKINQRYQTALSCYDDLWQWSVDHQQDFWKEVWDFCDVISHQPFDQVVDHEKKMPGAKWFSGAQLNYAENLLRFRDDQIALYFSREDHPIEKISYRDLFHAVEKAACVFQSIGLRKGDRVAAIVPNCPEAVIAMLAATSMGAVWSSCSPDFGTDAILSRISQIEPTLLLVVDGYQVKGEKIDCLSVFLSCQQQLPSIQHTLVVPYIHDTYHSEAPHISSWPEQLEKVSIQPLTFEPVAADHPLYILFSSGTTGLPKCIVHGTAGTLIQHLKEHQLHGDLRRDDTLFFYTTTSWMMWNWLVSALSVGCSIVLVDGTPSYPGLKRLWSLTESIGITHFGTSPKYLSALQAKNCIPKNIADLSTLKVILTTGSPLSEEQFDFIDQSIQKGCQVSSIAGGTDIVSCFFLGNPISPVYRGCLQGRGLGMDVIAVDSDGKPVSGSPGELICLSSAPSMPIYFYNDKNHEKYRKAYFEEIPGVWHHGDNITIHQNGSIQIWGRSDATLNPSGVRIGTAEIYQVIDQIEAIEDSVVVGQTYKNDQRILCFVTIKEGFHFTPELVREIKRSLAEKCSKYHVPKQIFEVPEIPYTMNGKKMEIAVKKAIHGESVINKSTLSNPDCLDFYEQFHQKLTYAQPHHV